MFSFHLQLRLCFSYFSPPPDSQIWIFNFFLNTWVSHKNLKLKKSKIEIYLCPLLNLLFLLSWLKDKPLLLHLSYCVYCPCRGRQVCLLPGTVVENASAVTSSAGLSVECVSSSSDVCEERTRGENLAFRSCSISLGKQPHTWDLGLQSIPTTVCFSKTNLLMSLPYLENSLDYLLFLDQNPNSLAHTRSFTPQPSCHLPTQPSTHPSSHTTFLTVSSVPCALGEPLPFSSDSTWNALFSSSLSLLVYSCSFLWYLLQMFILCKLFFFFFSVSFSLISQPE